MIVLCEKCKKKYRIDDNKISKKGLKVKCSNCKHIFHVKRKEESSKKSSSKTSNLKNSSQDLNTKKQPESNKTKPAKPIKTEVTHLPDYAEWDDDIIIVNLQGETLDAANCQDFKEEIHNILETPNRVIFNMDNIKFVDSSGCGTLNSSIKRIKKIGGDIKICNVQDQVAAIFRLIKLNRVFQICDTLEDAIQAFNA